MKAMVKRSTIGRSWTRVELRLNPPEVGDTLIMRVQLWNGHEFGEALVISERPDSYEVAISLKGDKQARTWMSKHELWKKVYAIKRKENRTLEQNTQEQGTL